MSEEGAVFIFLENFYIPEKTSKFKINKDIAESLVQLCAL
jgi:hypothetical protein